MLELGDIGVARRRVQDTLVHILLNLLDGVPNIQHLQGQVTELVASGVRTDAEVFSDSGRPRPDVHRPKRKLPLVLELEDLFPGGLNLDDIVQGREPVVPSALHLLLLPLQGLDVVLLGLGGAALGVGRFCQISRLVVDGALDVLVGPLGAVELGDQVSPGLAADVVLALDLGLVVVHSGLRLVELVAGGCHGPRVVLLGLLLSADAVEG